MPPSLPLAIALQALLEALSVRRRTSTARALDASPGSGLEFVLLRLQMERKAKKLSKDEAKALRKVEECIARDDVESARVYAQTATQAKNEGRSLIRLSARLSAVASRVDSALRMKQLTAAMSSVTRGMETVLGSMDASKISKMMDKFESQFETLDVRASFMGDAIDSATGSTAPAEEIDEVIARVAAAKAIELKGQFAEIPSHAKPTAAASSAPAAALPAGMPPPPSGGPGTGGDSGAGGSAAGGTTGGGGGRSVADDLQARLDALRG